MLNSSPRPRYHDQPNSVSGRMPGHNRQDKRPSKLELMRADYQKKLLKEKEEKMVLLYEENQKRAMSRVNTRYSNGAASSASTNGNGTFVRDFFKERRRMEAKGMPVPPIDNHYKQAKTSSAWSSRAGSGNSTKRVSAGRDRSQPLSPIKRQEFPDAPNRPGIPQRATPNANNENDIQAGGDGQNPFDNKSRIVRHKPLPRVDPNNNRNINRYSSPQKPKVNTANTSSLQQKPHGNNSRIDNSRGQKMTDFQKWQLQQNKAREDRLKKHNNENSVNGNDENEGYWGQPERDVRGSGYDESKEDDNGEDDEVTRKEQELMAMISRRQAELDRIKKQREMEAEEDHKEEEKRRKQEVRERARQRKLETERQEQEERKRKLEEEREREREREEIRQREEEEEARRLQQTKTAGNTSQRRSKRDDNQHEEHNRNYYQEPPKTENKKKVNKINRSPPPRMSEETEDRDIKISDANFYLEMANAPEAKGSTGRLSRCKLCGRQFAADRLKKHEDACAKANKPRKEYDASKKRVEGTEMAKYQGRNRKPTPPPRKNNWRAKHEEFLETLRYAKKVTAVEKQGGDLRHLPPPPASQNPDLVPCPHCGRTFNETAAERHIPRCQKQKTRPPPVKR